MSEAREPVISNRRRTLRHLLFAVVPVLAVVLGAWLFVSGGRYVTSDNAYVKADIVSVSAEVNGKLVAVAVRENQPVRAGDLLVSIDSEPFRVAVEEAVARLAQARLDVESLQAAYAQKQSALAAARDDLDFAGKSSRRVSDLFGRGSMSRSALDEAQNHLNVARNTVHRLESERAEALADLGGHLDRPVDDHPKVMVALATLAKARLDLARCHVYAPMDGVVAKVPKVGHYVLPGMAMISVVAEQHPWIEVNLKEDQLAGVAIGDRVTIAVDAYPGERWTASVESIGQATGAEFALLPPQNATGNWVKIVQRLPVRLAIDHHDNESALRTGLSAEVSIDTGIPARVRPLYDIMAGLGLVSGPAVAGSERLTAVP